MHGREGKGEKRKRINLSRATSSATMKRRADERGGEKRGWKGKGSDPLPHLIPGTLD